MRTGAAVAAVEASVGAGEGAAAVAACMTGYTSVLVREAADHTGSEVAPAERDNCLGVPVAEVVAVAVAVAAGKAAGWEGRQGAAGICTAQRARRRRHGQRGRERCQQGSEKRSVAAAVI